MHVDFPLGAGARIEGRVLGIASSDLNEVRLFLDGESWCSSTASTPDAYFVFRGLHPGAYRLQFDAAGDVLWYPGVESEEEAEVIALRESEQSWLEMVWPDSL